MAWVDQLRPFLFADQIDEFLSPLVSQTGTTRAA